MGLDCVVVVCVWWGGGGGGEREGWPTVCACECAFVCAYMYKCTGLGMFAHMHM